MIRKIFAALGLVIGALIFSVVGASAQTGTTSCTPKSITALLQEFRSCVDQGFASGCISVSLIRDILCSAEIADDTVGATVSPIVPASVVQISCGASINSAILANGGGADALHPILYQLAGTSTSPCTYSGQTFHTASNIIISGQADPIANATGASTILDGGQGSATGGVNFMTCGYPSTALPSGFCPGATGDGTSNVTLQYLTVKNYGGSKTCPAGGAITASISGTTLSITVGSASVGIGSNILGSGVTPGTYTISGSGSSYTLNQSSGTVSSETMVSANGCLTPGAGVAPFTTNNECGWQAYLSDTAENECPQGVGWNNWLLNHTNITLSGGYGFELAGGGGVVQNSLIDHNYHGGIDIQTTYATGNNGLPFSLINNEATSNNQRGDDPTNDAAGLIKTTSRVDLGGPENALNVINNYVHDNNASGIWSDIDSSHVILINGNTVINSLAPSGPYSTFEVDCIRVEVNSGYSEIAHNVMINCQNGYTLSLTNASNSNVHNNYSYVNNVDYTKSGGIVEIIGCRTDNPSGITPGVAVNVENNITVFAKNQNNNGAGGLAGYFDYTGTSNTPGGAGCANPFPSVAQYSTNDFGNRFGNLYYSPGGSADTHWGFAAQGNPGNTLAQVQGDGNPNHQPSSALGTVTGWGTGDCTVHIASIPPGFALYVGTSLWGTAQTTPITITSLVAGTLGGIGQYNINWCPTFASSGSPATLNAIFGGNQELGSSVRPGATLLTSTISAGGVLTLGANTATGTIGVGQMVAANDGTNKQPYGTYITALLSGGGQTTGSTWQLSKNPTPGAITSTTIYMNATKGLMLGCTNGIALGGCPTGSGI